MIKKLKRIPTFFREVRDELKKVNWSTRRELVTAGIIVVIASVLLTGYIFCVDFGLSHFVKLIIE